MLAAILILSWLAPPCVVEASNYINGTGEVYSYNNTQYQKCKPADILKVTASGWHIVKYTVSKDGFGDADKVTAHWRRQENLGSGSWEVQSSFKVDGKDLPITYTVSKSAKLIEVGLEGWFNPGYQDFYRGIYISKVVLENDVGDQETVYTGGGGPGPEPPGAPTIYLVDKGRDYIKIGWSASSGATGYKIYKGGTLVDTITGTSYTYTGLDPDTSYSLKIKAYNSEGDSPFSNTLNVKTDPIPPPDNFNVVDKGWNHVKTTWDPVSDVDGYKVYKDGMLVDTVSGTEYIFIGLDESSQYNLGVSAYKGSHESETKPLASGTQEMTCCDAIIQLLNSYLPDACADIQNIWQQISKDLPVISTSVNTIAENTGAIKNDTSAIRANTDTIKSDTGAIKNSIGALKDYITTPRGAPSLNVPSLPTVPINSSVPDMSEPAQNPYTFDRPVPQMPAPIGSPGALPFAPDPTIMPHDDPLLRDSPLGQDPINVEAPLERDPVNVEAPLERDPVSIDPPLAQDVVSIESPLAQDPVIGADGPVTAEPPVTPAPPVVPDPPKGD